MTAQTVVGCVVCGAATDRFLCGDERAVTGCLGKLLRDLGDCAALVEELDITISRCDKVGGGSIGFVTNGGDEQPLPINLAATESKLLLRDRLGTWVRDLWETNRGMVPHCSVCHVEQEMHAEGPSPVERTWYDAVPAIDVQNTIVSLSRWLLRHPSWLALHPAAFELYDEIGETIRLAWRAVDSAPDKVYIGTCSALLTDPVDHAVHGTENEYCDEELYAREGDWEKRCPTCSTIHDVRERQRVLSTAVEYQYVPARDLIGLVTDRGKRLTDPMLRSLRRRGKVAAFVVVPDGGVGAGVMDPWGFRVRVWTSEDPVSARLYLVGQVLDVITNKWARQAA